ncbi:hypothetical protein [Streptomyces sp. NPDC056056]|uniref:hypothetical protein n=1 Tax=Streptomyces sp. NPDC056056 TaxID=3345698 RepID=UPI0035E31BB6
MSGSGWRGIPPVTVQVGEVDGGGGYAAPALPDLDLRAPADGARESLNAYPAVRRLADAGLMSSTAAQFGFDVDVFIAGMEQRLLATGS